MDTLKAMSHLNNSEEHKHILRLHTWAYFLAVAKHRNIDLGQHWLRYWLVGWWHKTLQELMLTSWKLLCVIHLRVIL